MSAPAAVLRPYLDPLTTVTFAIGGRKAVVTNKIEGSGTAPLLRAVPVLEQSINHLPAPGDIESLRQVVRVEISNEPWQGFPNALDWILWELGTQLDDDRVTVRIESTPSDTGRPQRTHPGGSDTQARFVGVVAQLETVQRSHFVVRCEPALPSVQWLYARGAKTDPRDFGKRLPNIIGVATRVPCINYQVGWLTTTVQDLGAGYTGNFEVSDASGFPQSGTFNVLLGNETMTVSVVNATTLNVAARTNGKKQFAGQQVSEEIAEAIFVLSDLPVETIDRVEAAMSTGSDELVRVPVGTLNPADAAVIPGETVASLRLNTTELVQLYNLVAGQVEGDETTPGTDPTFVSENTSTFFQDPHNPASYSDVTDVNNRVFTWPATNVEESLVGQWTGSLSTTEVLRWAMAFEITWSGNSVDTADVSAWAEAAGAWPNSLFPPTVNLQLNNIGASGTVDITGNFRDVTGQGVTLNDLVTLGSAIRVYLKEEGIRPTTGTTFTFNVIRIVAELAGQEPVVSDVFGKNGFGIQLYSDVRGYTDPGELVSRYALDDATGWNVSNCVHVPLDETEAFNGTGAQGQAVGGNLIDTENDASNWSDAGTSVSSYADVYSPQFQKNVVEAVYSTGGATDGTQAQRAYPGAAVTGQGILLDFRPLIFYGRTDLLSVEFYLTDTAGLPLLGNYAGWVFDYDADFGDNEWKTVILDGNNPDLSQGLPFNPTHLIITIGKTSGGGPGIGSGEVGFQIHNVDAVATGATAILQKNDLPSVAFTDGTQDPISIAAYNALQAGDKIAVYLSGETVTGTNLPANNYAQGTLTLGAMSRWEALPLESVTVTGTMNWSAVQMIRFEIQGIDVTTGVYPPQPDISDGLGVVYDDIRQFQAASTVPYIAPQGAVLQHPLDIARAIIETSGGTIDETVWNESVAKTDLTLKLGFDFRAAGFIGAEALALVCYNGGVSAVYQPDGTWGLYAPDMSTYSWLKEEPDRIYTEWDQDGVVQIDANLERDAATDYVVYYDADVTQGFGDDIFKGSLLATPDMSELWGVSAAQLEAVEKRLGVRRAAQPIALQLVHDEHTANIIGGYYVFEESRLPVQIEVLGSPWVESWDAQVSEDVQIRIPASSTVYRGRQIVVRTDSTTEQRDVRFVQIGPGTTVAPPGPYAQQVVTKPSGAYFTATGNPPNSSGFTLSMWLQLTSVVPPSQATAVFFGETGTSDDPMRILANLNGTSDNYQFLCNSSLGGTASVNSDLRGFPDTSLHHLLLAVDGVGDTARFYIDNVDVSTIPTVTLNTIAWQDVTEWRLFFYLSAAQSAYVANVADFWFATTALDISSASVRENFITSGGQPVSLGTTGVVLGVTPWFYLGGPDYDAADWNAGTNRGAGPTLTKLGDPFTNV